MKWTRLLVLIILLPILLWAIPVQAGSSDTVVITATGWVCEAPGGFTVTYVNDYEVGLSWAKGEDAINTMVRAAYGRMPESRTDGYLVYYGEESYCSDTAVNLDETMANIYYRAWAQNDAGTWGEGSASGLLENMAVQQIAGVIFIISITALALWRKGIMLYIAGNLVCFFFSARWFTLSWQTGTGWEYGLGALGLAAFLMSMAVMQAFRGNIRA